MTFTDNFAYIGLFSIFVIALIVFVFLLLIRKKSSARISFITLLGTAIVGIDSLVAGLRLFFNPTSTTIFATFIFVVAFAAFLMIPYVIILLTFEPKKFEKLVPHSYNVNNEKALKEEEEIKKELSFTTGDDQMLAISQDFMIHGVEAFTNPAGTSVLLDYINRTIRERIKADGGAVLMIDDFEDVITVKSFEGDFPPPYKLPSDMPHKPVRVATNFKFASFPLKENIFGDIATKGKAELIVKPELDDRIFQNGPEEFLECGSYILVPLKVQDSVIGVTAFARSHGNPVFTEKDLTIATKLTDFAAASVKNVLFFKDFVEKEDMKKESEIASKIQEVLKPQRMPAFKGFQVGNIWNPIDGVCGDYYDVIPSRKDRVSFVMSDIAGKGMNSVVVMTMVRAMLHLVVNTTQSAGKILSWVNKGLSSETYSTDHFGSCALINYNPIDQIVELAAGGTTPVYYFDSATKEITKISGSNEPIGVDKTIEYKDYIQKVKTGDIIITYTDGLVEALNDKGQQYSVENLMRVIKTNCAASGKDIANRVKADIKTFCGNAELHDDQTLLVVKIQ